MRRWFFDVNYHRWDKSRRRFNRFLVLFVLIVLSVGGYLAYDAFLLASEEQQPSKPTSPIHSTYYSPSTTFTTPYFTVQLPDAWKQDKKSSTKNKFVYDDIRSKLVKGRVTIWVNGEPDDEYTRASRVLPAAFGTDNFLKPDSFVSDHCNKKAPSKSKTDQEMVKLKSITFMCDNDATWYSVLVGIPSQGTAMKLKRPNGAIASYIIHYQDATATPDPANFIDLVRKFQVR
jgi:hypothetical protein